VKERRKKNKSMTNESRREDVKKKKLKLCQRWTQRNFRGKKGIIPKIRADLSMEETGGNWKKR